jgi:fructokinase
MRPLYTKLCRAKDISLRDRLSNAKDNELKEKIRMIICCGESLIDMVPNDELSLSFKAIPGGCPFNTAIAAARLGSVVQFLGCVGKDFLGDSLFEAFERSTVDTSLVVRCDRPTTLAFVKRSCFGDARYAFYSEGAADRSFSAGDLPAGFRGDARFLMTGSISLVQEPIASTIEALILRESGRLLVSLDPNIRPTLISDPESFRARLMRCVTLAAVVKVSSEDLEWLFPNDPLSERAMRFIKAGAELVVETRGGEGAVAWTHHATASAPAFKVDIADTIGAGDTFHVSGSAIFSHG